MFRRILVANDGSSGGYLALEKAIGVAKKFRAELHMIVVEEWPMLGDMEATVLVMDAMHQQCQDIVDKSAAFAKSKRMKIETHLIQGFAAGTVRDFTENYSFDLLVVGWMDHCDFYRWLVGSTTDDMVNWALCSVLVVKDKTE